MSAMLNGQIYHGMNGKAGEIGYTMVGDEDITYKEIVERAKVGDRLCMELFERLGKYIAIAVCSANNFFNPQMIIFHASSCEFQNLYFEITNKFMKKNTYDKTVELKLSKLGKEVHALGGALIAIENVVFAN